jgi:hypothetical protein
MYVETKVDLLLAMPTFVLFDGLRGYSAGMKCATCFKVKANAFSL